MRIFLAFIASTMVLVALIELSWRSEAATAKAITGCVNEGEGLPIAADEKEAFVYRCMSYRHYRYSHKCGDAHSTKCYTQPGFLETKWFEVMDCLKFEEGSFAGSFKGCIRRVY